MRWMDNSSQWVLGNQAIAAHIFQMLTEKWRPIKVDPESDEEVWRETEEVQAPAAAASSTCGPTTTKETRKRQQTASKLEPTTPLGKIEDMTEQIMDSIRQLTFEAAHREQLGQEAKDTDKQDDAAEE